MLELVRYQKRELPKVAGAEYDVLNTIDILCAEKNRHGELGKKSHKGNSKKSEGYR